MSTDFDWSDLDFDLDDLAEAVDDIASEDIFDRHDRTRVDFLLAEDALKHRLSHYREVWNSSDTGLEGVWSGYSGVPYVGAYFRTQYGNDDLKDIAVAAAEAVSEGRTLSDALDTLTTRPYKAESMAERTESTRTAYYTVRAAVQDLFPLAVEYARTEAAYDEAKGAIGKALIEGCVVEWRDEVSRGRWYGSYTYTLHGTITKITASNYVVAFDRERCEEDGINGRKQALLSTTKAWYQRSLRLEWGPNAAAQIARLTTEREAARKARQSAAEAERETREKAVARMREAQDRWQQRERNRRERDAALLQINSTAQSEALEVLLSRYAAELEAIKDQIITDRLLALPEYDVPDMDEPSPLWTDYVGEE